MINVAVIGCGYWGPNLARNFADVPGARLHTICDLREERLAKVHRRFPMARVTRDYRDVLGDGEVDAVALATPATTHFGLAREILSSGRHVLVEKPLAMRVAECQELIDIAEQQGKVLMVGHTFEYNAAVRKLKELVTSGELGDVYYTYSARLNLGQVRTDVNALWNLAPHDVSILSYVLDREPVQVMAKGVSYIQDGIEDVFFMVLDFPDGIAAHVHGSWLDPNKVRRTTVVGSEKMVVYDDVSREAKIQIYDKGVTRRSLPGPMGEYDTFGKFQLITRAGDIHIPKIDFVEPLKLECTDFVDCINNGGRPLADGYDGLRVVKVLEAAQRSLASGGKTQKI